MRIVTAKFLAVVLAVLVLSSALASASTFQFNSNLLNPLDIERDLFIFGGPGNGEDPLLPKEWHLYGANIYNAWKYTRGASTTVIAIVDSGVDYTHPDIQNNVWINKNEIPRNGIDDDHNGFVDDTIGWNYVNGKWGVGNNDPMDRAGHGTFITGLIAATQGNGIGSVGICPWCKVMPVRFINGEGMGDTEDAILAIRYAIRNHASVINLSFAGEGYDKDLHDVLQEAMNADIVVTSAAGNDGIDNDKNAIYPPNYSFPNMLTVAATDESGVLWQNSSWGHHKVHIAAPGVDLVGPWIKNDYWLKGQGTSFSAPIVAAIAGLVRTINPSLNASQVVSILKATVKKSNYLSNKIQSGGVVDAGAAVACAYNANLPCLSRY